jgi:UDP-glucose 4-epimerase
MRILVTGASGCVGRGLLPALLDRGHRVVALDKEPGVARRIAHPRLSFVEGAVEEPAAVALACRDIEAVVHLAWSFSDDPRALVEGDLRGHALLLEAARTQAVRHFLYASTAVVYGKPAAVPVAEDHPLDVLAARKPAYGIAKAFAEQLTLLAGRAPGLSATVVRFWWAFGETIPGKHLREMLTTAAAGRPLAVPAECGGSFLTQEDFNAAVLLLLERPGPGGRLFNLASAYVGWDEVARMTLAATGGTGGVEPVPRGAWTGAAFLADRWELDTARIRSALGFSPTRDAAGVREALARAIRRSWQALQGAADKSSLPSSA